MYYYEVIPTKIFRASSGILTYEHPEKLPTGTIVIIPLGKKTIPGLIIKQTKKPSFPTKPITKILYDQPLPPHLLKGIRWLSQYYSTPLPTVLSIALPRGVEKKRRGANLPSPFSSEFSPAKTATYIPDGTDKVAVAEGRLQSLPDAQRMTCRALSGSDEKAARRFAPLNSAQQSAISQIDSTKSNTILLHGITGSGKTNIYLHLTAEQLKKGNSVIILVPEIALTSQLVQVFQSHFGNITLLHSKQTESERHLLWQKILNYPNAQIIIGPRSALFAPVLHLGLIIIDEAHEPAFVQAESPKYSALRLASIMSRTILGTATPLAQDFYLADKNHALVTLDQLAIKSDKKATIKVIDLKNKAHFKRHRLLSDALIASIQASLDSGTQSMLYHNRRGTSALTICDHCGWQAICPSCLLPLTLHSDKFTLLCHTCGYKHNIPTSCPDCHNARILHKGFGTKYLEQELTKLFPSARIARFDSDTPDALTMKNIYTEVKSGEINIIIGTQTIAKGFDFPHLTTLGVVQADSQLSLPDFSSEERTYQLLTQVIGRANRGHQDTQIFIQTYQPDHPTITTAIKSDYTAFYSHLLTTRRQAQLPPYSYLLKLTLTYKTEKTTIKNIKNLKTEIEDLVKKQFLNKNRTFCSEKELKRRGREGDVLPLLSISAPMPAFHERTPKGYTWQLIIKSKSRQTLLTLLTQLPTNPHLHSTLDPPTLLEPGKSHPLRVAVSSIRYSSVLYGTRFVASAAIFRISCRSSGVLYASISAMNTENAATP